MGEIRAATEADLVFLVQADLRADGDPPDPELDAEEHHAKIARFVWGPHDEAWLHEVEGPDGRRPVGMLLARFRDPVRERTDPFVSMLVARVLTKLPAGWWAPEDRFAEVYQLWVEPSHRRQGIATGLKRHLEARARARGIGLVYTNTRDDNPHVVTLNLRLGYVEVRRGGLWDSQVRVSLVKRV